MSKKLLLCLTVLCLLLYVQTSRANDIDPGEQKELNAMASSISGQLLVVHCNVDSDSEFLGYTIQTWDTEGVSDFQDEIWLQAPICRGLLMLLRPQPRYQVVRTVEAEDRYVIMGTSIMVLQHEANHISLNNGNEAVVDCWAVRHVRRTLQGFHLSRRVEWAVYQAARDFHRSSGAPYTERC